ncbi:DNA-3-methyladenine glycosylase I [Luteimicrobium sp. DT211]|uniref:DNA-3-methyladenine glycosylase I n=1 Tax=Luteimicrobium sp. DT211 TaxID=3393412 RepID=UPI003CF5880F
MTTTPAAVDDGAPPTPRPAGARCFGDGDPLYERYHDTEWGEPVHGEAALLERLALEGFQSGLSWLTVLRKREAFRSAFAGFDAETVAAFGPDDVERLLQDASIIRNRQKIEATITNARALVALHDAGGSLDELVWSFAPEPRPERATSFADVPGKTAESLALSKALKKAGFVFVGPTTAYAMMQACGLVDDHLATCPVVLARTAEAGAVDRALEEVAVPDGRTPQGLPC